MRPNELNQVAIFQSCRVCRTNLTLLYLETLLVNHGPISGERKELQLQGCNPDSLQPGSVWQTSQSAQTVCIAGKFIMIKNYFNVLKALKKNPNYPFKWKKAYGFFVVVIKVFIVR